MVAFPCGAHLVDHVKSNCTLPLDTRLMALLLWEAKNCIQWVEDVIVVLQIYILLARIGRIIRTVCVFILFLGNFTDIISCELLLTFIDLLAKNWHSSQSICSFSSGIISFEFCANRLRLVCHSRVNTHLTWHFGGICVLGNSEHSHFLVWLHAVDTNLFVLI